VGRFQAEWTDAINLRRYNGRRRTKYEYSIGPAMSPSIYTGIEDAAAFRTNASKQAPAASDGPNVDASEPVVNGDQSAQSSEPPEADTGAGDQSNQEYHLNPVARLMALSDQGAAIETLFAAMNQAFAVTRYGGEIVIAFLRGTDITFVSTNDFHKMFANLEIVKQGVNKRLTFKASKRWFEWKGRRQYLGRGVVFEPGAPLDVPNDLLNLYRGFGVTPARGDWSLMRSHIFNVVCSGNHKHFNYLIRLMAWGVQHLDKPLGVAVALLGPQGAGKGVFARTYGKLFGKHFSHITHGEQLTGRFNAGIGTACAIFLDEAVWAADKKGEGTLKALITEPTLQLEAKFRDPIMVENRLRIMIASNSEWAVPAGIGDRRWFVLTVADTYAGTKSRAYWDALYAELENGGEAAMLFDLLEMDLSGFDVRDIPNTAAKAQQQVHSLQGSLAWLHDVLQEGSISGERWQDAGLAIEKDRAYLCYEDFSKRQHNWRPETKPVWSRNIHAALGSLIGSTRPTKGDTRVRVFQFAALADCRRQFASHLGATDLVWQVVCSPNDPSEEVPEGSWDHDHACPDPRANEWEPETDPEQEYEIAGVSPD
jgi:hypothetical protein